MESDKQTVRIESDWTEATLYALIEKLDANVSQRFAGLDITRDAATKAIDERFKHIEQMFAAAQRSTEQAATKAEGAQALVNVAANEWRSTVGDFRLNTITRAEFDRFYSEFSAYRLAATTAASQQSGKSTGVSETKQANMAQLALVATVAGTLAAVVMSVVTAFLRGSGHA